jgi:hypothetical protein
LALGLRLGLELGRLARAREKWDRGDAADDAFAAGTQEAFTAFTAAASQRVTSGFARLGV